MERSDLTVIVVGYNHAPYVIECIESIRKQSVAPDAVIVVDDASTDASREVIEAYARKHENLFEFYPNSRNLGLTPTLNAALTKVTTTYVTYIAADDVMLQGRIEEQISVMRSTHAELSYSDATVIDAGSGQLFESSRVEFPWPEEPSRSHSVLEQLFEANWIPAASIVMRTDSLRQLGGYDASIFFEDFELLTRAAAAGWRFAYLDRPLVAVRRLDTSLGAIGFAGQSPRFIVAMDAALRNYPQDGTHLAKKVMAKRWELAKRASRTAMPFGNKLSMMLAARSGARSSATFVYHLARLMLIPTGVGKSSLR